ncbi:MAG: hypothetical protein ACOYXR_04000 [Nitrospirota bacterium]
MRTRFYVAMMVVVVGAAFLVDYLMGKLYVRYMILFSGAIFLWGMAVGQRSEQAWMRRQSGRPVGIMRRPRFSHSDRETSQ